ncbi:hypothetical protein [Sphingomonas beigongshangi]|jgi:hypothetical protein|uniref:hypothetical protein n=1 Tax=Sphingomonas beigongshangi TaxID=2782540 RepID=UPI001AEDB1A7|nr:hypothetical protein [Sphingomonas beigongshangi]
MIPGPRLFRSRWAALLWAAGLLWAVADMAGGLTGPHRARPATPGASPTPEATPDGSPAQDPDVAALVNALG